MDAASLALLRSSFAGLRSRFQAAADRGAQSKAWLVHAIDSGDKTPSVFRRAKGFNPAKGGLGVGSSCLGTMRVFADGRKEVQLPPSCRWVQLEDWDSLQPAGDDAARLLDSLPGEIKARLWSGLPERSMLEKGLPLWGLAVFELANAKIGPALRADRLVPSNDSETTLLESVPDLRGWPFHLTDEQIAIVLENGWYSTLDNFAAASVYAIDILLSWLDTAPVEPAATSSGEDAKPKGTAGEASTDAGGRGGKAASGKRPRKVAKTATLVEQAIRNHHKFDGGDVDRTVSATSGRKLAASSNKAFSARAVDRWIKARFGSKAEYESACVDGTLGKRLALNVDDLRAFGTFDHSTNEIADDANGENDDDESIRKNTVPKRGGIARRY